MSILNKLLLKFTVKRILTIVVIHSLTVLSVTAGTIEQDRAKKVTLNSSFFKAGSHAMRNDISGRETLGVSADDDFDLLTSGETAQGKMHYRFRQRHKGIPIFGRILVATRDKNEPAPQHIIPGETAATIRGSVAKNFRTAVNPAPTITASSARDRVIQKMHADNARKTTAFYETRQNELVWFTDDADAVHLAYCIDVFSDDEQTADPMRRIYIIDAHTGAIIKEWNALTHAKIGYGHGGNVKTGKYIYGMHYPNMDVTAVSSSLCIMSNNNVMTVHMSNQTTGGSVVRFPYCTNWDTPANEAYSPENDAQFLGSAAFNMYTNWIGIPPISNSLVQRVHYAVNYENAFWNGSNMTYGDGYTKFYPMLCADVVAHEISHGYTEQQSGLIYSGQSGGINEAFSDMAGEALEYFITGSNDFLVGAAIAKTNVALRYMNDPHLDGKSIAHIGEYNSSIDVHYSSGIFNKAFYILATSPGWNTRKAFEVFAYANRYFWTPSVDFFTAAADVETAATDLGYPVAQVRQAFKTVGAVSSYYIASNTATGAQYHFIQDAINASTQNYTVYIYSNSSENLMITNRTNLTITTLPSAGGPVTLNGYGKYTNGIDIRNTSGITVSNIKIKQWSYGIYLSNTILSYVTKVESSSNINYGICDDAGSGNRFISNNCNSNNYGIYFLSYASYDIIAGNLIQHNRSYGMYLNNPLIITITNNFILSNASYGVYLYSGRSNRIMQNYCTSNTAGVYLSSCNDSEIVSNTILQSKAQSICVYGNSNIVWCNNMIGFKDYSYILSGISNKGPSNYITPRHYNGKNIMSGGSVVTPWNNSFLDFSHETVPPLPVTGITAATNIADPSIVEISWNPSTEADFSYYMIFRALSSSFSNVSDFDIVGTNYLSSHTVLTDRPGFDGTYYYYVTAVDTNGNESWYPSPAAVTFSRGLIVVSNASTGAVFPDLQSAFSAVSNNETLHIRTNCITVGAVISNRTNVTVTGDPLLPYTPTISGCPDRSAFILANCIQCAISNIAIRNAATGIVISNTVSGSNIVAAVSLIANLDGILIVSPENRMYESFVASNIRYGINVSYATLASSNIFFNNYIVANNSIGLYLQGGIGGVSNRVESNCFFKNSTAININSRSNIILNNHIYSNNTGVSLSSTLSTVSGNNVYLNTSSGISASGISNCIISNTFNSNNNGMTMGFSTTKFNTISYNTFLSNSSGIMPYSGCITNYFSSNQITQNYYGVYAISLGNAYESNIFQYNMISSNSYGYFGVNNTTNLLIANIISNNKFYDIYLQSAAYCIATSNYYGTRTYASMKIYGSPQMMVPWRLNPLDFTKEIDPPDVPTNLTAVTNTLGMVAVSWNPVAAADLSGYNVFRSASSNYSNVLDSDLVAKVNSGTVYTDVPPTNGTYFYYITASDTNGNEGWYSGGVMLPYISLDNAPTVTNFTATVIPSSRRIVLRAGIADANGDTMDGYFEYSETGWGNWTPIPVTALRSAVTGLPTGAYSNIWDASGVHFASIDVRFRVSSKALTSAYAYATVGGLNTVLFLQTDLAGVKTLNNPYRGSGDGIAFVNLTEDAEISIYTIAGQFVAKCALDKNSADGAIGKCVWNVKNANNRPVAAGVYVCVITSPSLRKTKIIRVMIAR